MVPTNFEPAQHVLPEIVLNGAGHCEDFGRTKKWRASRFAYVTVDVLGTAMEAELLCGSEGRIQRIRTSVRIVIGSAINIPGGVVNRCTQLQSGDRSC